ncbi:MAG: TonB-dependent receptor [Bacteroidota bacterium]
MKKNEIITLIMALSTTLAFSQDLTQTVRGTICDTDNQQPLTAAEVLILGTNPLVGTITDENGKFRLEHVPVGRITLQLFYLGYEDRIIPNIEVNSGKEVVLDLHIQESAVQMEEVVVKAYKNKGQALNDMSLVSSRSISPEETRRYAGGFTDPSRLLSSFAGVTSTPDGGNDITVRGNSPKYIQWRVDGVEIPNPYHFDDQNSLGGEGLSVLNNNLLAASDFYTGAFSPEYGDVLSSVMDVKLRTGNNEHFESTIGVGLLGTDLTLEGPFKRGYGGSYLVNYRYSISSLISDLGLVDDSGIVKFQDATFKVVLPTRTAGTFSLFGVGGLSMYSFEDVTPETAAFPDNKTRDRDHRKDYDKGTFLGNVGLNHTRSFRNNSYLKTSFCYSASGIDDKVYQSNPATERILSYNNSLLRSAYSAAGTYHLKLNAKNKIRIGAKYTLTDYDFKQSMLQGDTAHMFTVVDFKEHVGSANGFVSWKHRINDKITLVSGLHYFHLLFNNTGALEPRLALNWKINPSNSLHAGYGKHSTMESVHNYFTRIEMEDGSVAEPNKELDLLKAHHFVLGYEKRFSKNLMAKAELYYQHLYDLPVENNDTSYYATINEGIDFKYVDLVNKGTGKNYGVELTLERFFADKYYFMINASLFNSTYKSLENIERNTAFNNHYLVNVLAGKEFENLGRKDNQTLAINTRLFFGGGKKIIPLLRDSGGNLDVDPENNRYWDYQKAYDTKLDDILQLNLSVSYKFNRPRATHEIFIDLMNVTNNQGRISEYYDESQPGSIGYITQFSFFPILMYRVYF